MGAGFFGGEGFILERAVGDGKFVVHAGGKVIKKQLQGETLRVDTGCLVAFTDGIDYDIAPAGNVGSMLFGGEGLFVTTLSGSGTVLLQRHAGLEDVSVSDEKSAFSRRNRQQTAWQSWRHYQQTLGGS